MKKINGITLVEIDYDRRDPRFVSVYKLSRLVSAACDRFFVSRGMNFDYNNPTRSNQRPIKVKT